MKKIVLPLIFVLSILIPGQITAQIMEGFETGIPSDWTVIDNDGQGRTWIAVDNTFFFGDGIHNGFGAVSIRGEVDPHDDYFITPQISVATGTVDKVSFFASGGSPSNPQNIIVKLSTTGTAVSDFTETLGTEVVDTGSGNYNQYSFDLSAYDGQTVHIAIVANFEGLYTGFDVTIDDFRARSQPSCPSPLEFSKENLTESSVDISWEPEGSENEWQFIFGEFGFDPDGGGTSVTITGDPSISLNNLSGSTRYSFYVRAICSDDDQGDLSFSDTFLTQDVRPENDDLCDALPLTVDESCSGNPYSNSKATNQDGEQFGNCLNIPGIRTVWFTFVAPESGNVTVTTDIPGITLSDSQLAVYEAPADCTDLSTMGQQVGCNDDGGSIVSPFTAVASLSNLVSGDTYYVQVSGANSESGDFCIEVNDDGACLMPSNVFIYNIDAFSAEVNWTANGTVTEWELLYGESGFSPDDGEGNSVIVNGSPSTTLNNLSPGTEYDVYIRTICDEDQQTDLTNAASFTTDEFFPDNDDLCDAIPLTIDESCTGNTYTNLGATLQANEPSGDCLDSPGDTSVWFTFTAPVSGNVIVTTDIAGATLTDNQLTIYESPADCTDLSTLGMQVGCDEDGGSVVGTGLNATAFLSGLTAGETYYVKVSGNNGAEGNFCIEVNDQGTCSVPSGLTVENITASSANVSWTANSGETEWEILYGESGFESGDGTTLTINGSPNTTLENLDPDTEYDVFVRAICNENQESELSNAESFTTRPLPPTNDDLCSAIALTIDEACTGNTYTNLGATLQANEPSGDCFDSAGETTVWFSFTAPASGNVTVTTDITGATLTDTELAIYEAPTDCTDLSTLGTQLGCDEDGGSLVGMGFTSVASLTNLTAGETYYVQVDGNASAEGDFCIEVNDDGTCLKPSAVTIDNIDISSVDVSWTANGDEDEWVVIYGEAGFDPDGEGETISVTTNPNTSLTNLNPDTEYAIYVKAICGQNNESLLSDVESFTTDLPCPKPTGLVGESTGIDSADLSWTENGDATQWIVIYGEVGFDPDGEGETINVTNNPSTSLTDLNPDTEYDVYVKAVCGQNNESPLSDPASFTTDVPCPKPTELSGEGTGFNSADLSWTENGSATQWIVIYGETGFDPEENGTSETVNGSPELSLSGLEMNTSYEFYVNAICIGEVESGLAGPEPFSTNYCQPDIAGNVEPITLVNVADINNSSDAAIDGTPAIEDFTDLTAQINRGGAYPIALEGNTNGDFTNNFTVFIDWNQNGLFTDDGEMYEIGTITNSNGIDGQQATGTIDVPNDAILGTTRMRVYKNFNSFPEEPCSSENYGQIEDYSVQVNESVDCPDPTTIVIDMDEITNSSAVVSWTENGTATEWKVLYGESGFNPTNDEGLSENVTGDPIITLTDLDPDTAYDVYVRAICGDDNQSGLAGPETFNTTLGLDEQAFNEFTFYPNPVKNQLTLKAGNQIAQVEVFNLLGQRVMNTRPNTVKTHLNVERLQSGMYLMKVSISGKTKTIKFIKE